MLASLHGMYGLCLDQTWTQEPRLMKNWHVAVLNSFQFQNGNFDRETADFICNVSSNISQCFLLNQPNIMLTLASSIGYLW
jgi:hypothetical protein